MEPARGSNALGSRPCTGGTRRLMVTRPAAGLTIGTRSRWASRGAALARRRAAVLVRSSDGDAPRKGSFIDRLPGSQLLKRVLSGSQKERATRGPAKADSSTVLVAGATGRLGSRCVRELLVAGKSVRAGARDPAAAKKELEKAVQAGFVTAAQARRVEIVPFDLEKLSMVEAALQGVSKVVCAVGAPESDVLNTTAPRRIDGEGTISLIRAAASAGVSHFVLVTSLGTGKLGFPAGVLNLFWGVLTWKRKAEVALEESGMPYTIIRPGGMERPTDEYKATHNLRLLPRDTTFGGQVSRLQVAELVAAAISSPAVAQNKVMEVVAETTAPILPFDDLMTQIEADITEEQQAKISAALDAARTRSNDAKAALASAQQAFAAAQVNVERLAERVDTLKAQEATVRGEVKPVLAEGSEAEKALQAAKNAVNAAVLRETSARSVLEAAQKAASKGELLSAAQQKAAAEAATKALEPAPVAKQQAAKPQPAKAGGLAGLFGGGRPQVQEPKPVPTEAPAPVKAAAAAVPAAPAASKLKSAAPAPAAAKSAAPAAPAASKPKSAVPAPAAAKPAAPAAPAASKPKSAAPAPAAAKPAAPEAAKAERAAPKAVPAKTASPPSDASKGGDKPSLFGALFGASDAAVQLEAGSKAPKVPSAPEPPASPAVSAAPAAAPKPAPKAPPAAPPQPKQAAAAPAAVPAQPAGSAGMTLPREKVTSMATSTVSRSADAQEIEARVLAQTRQARAVEAAKARLAASQTPAAEKPKPAAAAAAPAAPPQAEAKKAEKPAPEATPASEAEKPVAAPAKVQEAQKPPAAAAKAEKPVAPATPAAKADAQPGGALARFFGWGRADAALEAPAAVEAAAKAAGTAEAAPVAKPAAFENALYDAEAAARSKAEAAAWIASWRAKQAPKPVLAPAAAKVVAKQDVPAKQEAPQAVDKTAAKTAKPAAEAPPPAKKPLTRAAAAPARTASKPAVAPSNPFASFFSNLLGGQDASAGGAKPAVRDVDEAAPVSKADAQQSKADMQSQGPMEAARRKADAQRWIAEWRASSQTVSAGTRKKEAQQWIAGWRNDSQQNPPAEVAGSPGSAAARKEEAQKWISEWRARQQKPKPATPPSTAPVAPAAAPPPPAAAPPPPAAAPKKAGGIQGFFDDLVRGS